MSERVGMEVVAMQGAAMQGAAKQGSMLAQERVLPSPLDRRDTVMPSSWDQLLQITGVCVCVCACSACIGVEVESAVCVCARAVHA